MQLHLNQHVMNTQKNLQNQSKTNKAPKPAKQKPNQKLS